MKNDLDKVFSRRKFILSLLYVGGNAILMGKLYYLQIPNNEKYSLLSDKNRTRYIMLDAKRGKIFDINGTVIADNIKTYQVMYENYRNNSIENVIKELSLLIVISKTEIEEIHKQLKLKKDAILIKKNIDWHEITAIESNIFNLPGLYIIQLYKRYYPYQNSYAHIIGYVTNHKKIGISGLELLNNDDLVGKSGIMLREVNSHGGIIKESLHIDPIPGTDIKISINSKIQNFSYKLLYKNSHKMKSGSVVILDIENGNILTLTNFPSYDNNIFVDGISDEEWKKLNETDSNPFINRCINFKINPGSTFKMVAAISALEAGLITQHTEFECKGYIEIGNKKFNCWHKTGHGKIKLKEAISMSCNVYFYNLALKINIDVLLHYAELFGLSNYFNIGFKDEIKATIPNQKWRSQNMNERWYLGDTMNTIIGHGYMSVTPMHLAVMAARLASGKYVLPSLNCIEKRFENIEIDVHNLNLIQKSMFDVINSKHGTANIIASSLQYIAGKTGTVQTISNINLSTVEEKVENHHHTSVFVGYAPYNNPKYAISVTMEQGGGGKNAAKIAQEILDYIALYIN